MKRRLLTMTDAGDGGGDVTLRLMTSRNGDAIVMGRGGYGDDGSDDVTIVVAVALVCFLATTAALVFAVRNRLCGTCIICWKRCRHPPLPRHHRANAVVYRLADDDDDVRDDAGADPASV